MTIDAQMQVKAMASATRQAFERRSPTEQTLDHALLDLISETHVAIEFLRLLTDQNSEHYDAAAAMVARAVTTILLDGGDKAMGAHVVAIEKDRESAVH